MQEKVTISLDDKVLKEFREFCEKNDIMLSKRIERLLSEHLAENKKLVKK